MEGDSDGTHARPFANGSNWNKLISNGLGFRQLPCGLVHIGEDNPRRIGTASVTGGCPGGTRARGPAIMLKASTIERLFYAWFNVALRLATNSG